MNILEGEIPKVNTWRVLIALSPGEKLGMAGEFGYDLARANDGQFMVAVFVAEADQAQVAHGQETLRAAVAAAAADKMHVDGGFLIGGKGRDVGEPLRDFVRAADVDLVLARSGSSGKLDLDALDCNVGILRGQWELIDEEPLNLRLRRILVPTAGGPHTRQAFEFLLPLASKQEVEITAINIVKGSPGSDEALRGQAILNEALKQTDAEGRIKSKVVSAWSAEAGIMREAQEGYDIVVLGASNDTPLDRIIFGDVVGAVVRQSHTPVVVMRHRHQRGLTAASMLATAVRHVFPRINRARRAQIYIDIRRHSRATNDFFMLISLSAAIASFGLLLSSPAVVIGAMLVAPLMSPIVGTGLAAVKGDGRFLRLALGSVALGALLAISVGGLVGLLRLNTPLTPEILARTQPSLFDLGVALFSGLAGAYIICYLDTASSLAGVAIAAALVPPLASCGIALVTGHYGESLGALGLFMTNFVAISLAAAIIFFSIGFRPTATDKEGQSVRSRSVRIALLLLALTAAVLGTTTFELARNQRRESRIREVAAEQLAAVTAGEAEIDAEETRIEFEDGVLALDLTAVSERTVFHQEVVDLREQIFATLEAEGFDIQEIALNLTVIRVTQLDPQVLPTATPTPSPVATPTPLLSTAVPIPTFTPVAP